MTLNLKAWWTEAQIQNAKQWPWPLYKGEMPPMCERCVDAIDAGNTPTCNCVRKNMTTEVSHGQ